MNVLTISNSSDNSEIIIKEISNKKKQKKKNKIKKENNKENINSERIFLNSEQNPIFQNNEKEINKENLNNFNSERIFLNTNEENPPIFPKDNKFERKIEVHFKQRLNYGKSFNFGSIEDCSSFSDIKEGGDDSGFGGEDNPFGYLN